MLASKCLVRIRRRLSYANVVATLALVLAIGGGTAAGIIVIGGKTGFDAVKGIGAREPLLAIEDVGALHTSCDEGGVIVDWKNRTDMRQLVFVDEGGTEPTAHSFSPGETGIILQMPGPAMPRLHVLRPAGGGTPMAEVGFIIYGRDCDTALVGVQSESSE